MLLSEVKDIPWLFSELARPSLQDQNTQEVPGNVDRQDYSQGQQGNHCHEQDDVALEGQICHGINATFTSDLLIPATEQRRCNLRICKCWVFPRSVINMHIFRDVAVAPYRPNLDKNDPYSFYLILSKKLWHHYFGVRICGYQIREVQETQCHKIEKKKKKRSAHWSHGSPHIENSQGGFALRLGSQGEPLAEES